MLSYAACPIKRYIKVSTPILLIRPLIKNGGVLNSFSAGLYQLPCTVFTPQTLFPPRFHPCATVLRIQMNSINNYSVQIWSPFSIDDFRHNTFTIQINHVVIIGISRTIWCTLASLAPAMFPACDLIVWRGICPTLYLNHSNLFT